MKKDEYLEKLEELQKQRYEIHRKIVSLKHEFLLSCQPYPIGTKLEVKYVTPRGVTKVEIGIVKSYRMDGIYNEVYPVLAEVKKNGGPAKRKEVFIPWYAKPTISVIK